MPKVAAFARRGTELPFVSKMIDESVIMMTRLLKFAGLKEKNMSPFLIIFTSSMDLLDSHIT